METEIEKIINDMQWIEAPIKEQTSPPIDVFHEALVETGRIAADTLKEFEVLGNVGRVVLVKFEPSSKVDPIVPIVLNYTEEARSAVRAFIALLYESHRYSFYQKATEAAARYLSACRRLNEDEQAYLEKQLQLCVVDPMRKIENKRSGV